MNRLQFHWVGSWVELWGAIELVMNRMITASVEVGSSPVQLIVIELTELQWLILEPRSD